MGLMAILLGSQSRVSGYNVSPNRVLAAPTGFRRWPYNPMQLGPAVTDATPIVAPAGQVSRDVAPVSNGPSVISVSGAPSARGSNYAGGGF